MEILQQNLIFKGITGSQLYGTATPESDTDIRGVFIAPTKYYFGIPLETIEEVETRIPDVTLWEIRKFFKLCIASNPNILELLFIPDDFVLYQTDIWREIINNRNLFLSSKTRQTFTGYAQDQLKRIRTHREWLLHPLERQPKRSDFGLPEDKALVTKAQLNAYIELTHNYSNEMVKELRIETNFLLLLQKEHEYQNALKQWNDYRHWEETRNPARHKLEVNFGYDTKHAGHTARLIEEGLELLTTGKITFPRPNRLELRAIIDGKYTYEELLSKYGDSNEMFARLETKYVIPQVPDAEKADNLCQSLVQRHLKIRINN